MRRFVRHNLIALVGQLGGILQGIVLVPLMVRSVGVSTYGTWVLLNSLLGFLFGISTLGVGYKKDRGLPSHAASVDRRRLFYPQLSFHLGMLLVLLFPVWSIARVLPTGVQDTFSPLAGGAYLMGLAAFAQTNSYLRYTGRIFLCTLQSTVQSLGQVGAVVGLAALGRLSIDGLLAVQSLVLFGVALPAAWLVAKELGGPWVAPTLRGLREDIALGLPLTISYVVELVLSISDRYVLALFLPRSFVGAYAAAYTLGSLPLLLPRAAGMVVPQMLIQAVDAGRGDNARAVVGLTYRLFMLAAIPFCVGAAVIGPDVLGLYAGPEIQSRAGAAVPIVAVGTALYGIGLLVGQVLFVQARTRTMLAAGATAAVFNLLLNFILLEMFPTVLVPAAVTLLSYALMLWMMSRGSEMNRRDVAVGVVVRAALASGAMGLALMLSGHGVDWSSVLARVAFGIAVYLGTLAALGTARLGDWRDLQRGLA